jgi:hypothetical protein
MVHPGSTRLLLLSAFALAAATRAVATETAAPPSTGVQGDGSCVIVEYSSVKPGGAGYTWYYCPSMRVYVRPGQRWITNFDTGIETRVLEMDRKVRTLPLSVKYEQRRAENARQSGLSFAATGKTEVIAGVPAEEYLVKLTFDGKPREVRQWVAKELPTPGRDKALASDPDKETALKAPGGVFLRGPDAQATSVRKGEPPESVLAIPADYAKQHWSKEKDDWVDGQ